MSLNFLQSSNVVKLSAQFVVALLLTTKFVWAFGQVDAKPKEAPADSVFLDGKIITLDKKNRIVEALAIRNGQIVAVGSNAEVKRFIGKATKQIRLKGKAVIPGLIETHCHSIGVARNALGQPFVELSSIAEVQNWLRKRAKEIPAGRWIRIPRTDITRLKERRHPTPRELDAACSTHPVIFNSARKNVLNSMGFRLMGITAETESIPGGRIIRDANGNLRMLVGGDGQLRKLFPRAEFSESEIESALLKVHHNYNQVGITSIFERASNLEGYKTYQDLHRRGKLTVRTTVTFRQQFRDAKSVEKFSRDLGLKTGDGDDWVKVGPLKISVDGGIHWGNTFLREAYGQKRVNFYVLDDPAYRGDIRYSMQLMTDVFAAGTRLGWQMCCHVTGDAGVDRVLDALESANKLAPLRDRRFTMTHAYFPAKDSIEKARQLGVCVDTQSYLYYKDSDAMAEVYGRDWAARFIGLGDWVNGGIPTAINSDHMIGLDADHAMNSYNPFLMLYIAVSRTNDHGKVYGKHQRLSREQALRCVTSMAAYLSFDEGNRGTLETGKLADLVVLDRDYLTCSVDEIKDIKPVMTVVAGKAVFER